MHDPLTSAELFNCCTKWAEPDWTVFTALEIGGCVNNPSRIPHNPDPRYSAGDETFIDGGRAYAEAEFFSIYGRKANGEAEVLTDCQDAVMALRVAAHLTRISGLPLVFYYPEG